MAEMSRDLLQLAHALRKLLISSHGALQRRRELGGLCRVCALFLAESRVRASTRVSTRRAIARAKAGE